MQNQDQNFILLLFILSLIAHSCASPKRHLIKNKPIENTFVLANIVNLKESLNQRSSVFQIRKGLALNKNPPLYRKGGKDFLMTNVSRNFETSFFIFGHDKLKLDGQTLGQYSILKQRNNKLSVEKVMPLRNYNDTVERYLYYSDTTQISLIKKKPVASDEVEFWYNFYYQDSLIYQHNRMKEYARDIFYYNDNKTYAFINDSELMVVEDKQVSLLATINVFSGRPFVQNLQEFTILGDWIVFAIGQNVGRTDYTVVNSHVAQLEYGLLCINYKTGESFLPDYELVDE